jgi:predicted naringenin-chalcone synthase
VNRYIHHIETILPPYAYRQDYARDRMVEWMPGRRNRRMIHGIYDHSGIETRYSVLPDFGPEAESLLFRPDDAGRIIEPSTGERNRCYRKYAGDLAVQAGQQTMKNAAGFSAGEVTHVITVSCTGFYNPGPDIDLIKGLDLPESTERYNIGFMGCYAAFPALRMADQFCRARPEAVVLIVCIELCSLHLQFREEVDSLLANSLFADGAAAVLVSAREPAENRSVLALESFTSALAPEGESEMAWEIGDRGFDIRLSTYVPNIIGGNIGMIVGDVLRDAPWKQEEIGTWAVHPGGRSIVDRIEKELSLNPEQLEDSREVLRRYGNMSSVTVLFVLHRILHRAGLDKPRAVCAMAFGPGLTIETVLMEFQPAAKPAAVSNEQ